MSNADDQLYIIYTAIPPGKAPVKAKIAVDSIAQGDHLRKTKLEEAAKIAPPVTKYKGWLLVRGDGEKPSIIKNYNATARLFIDDIDDPKHRKRRGK